MLTYTRAHSPILQPFRPFKLAAVSPKSELMRFETSQTPAAKHRRWPAGQMSASLALLADQFPALVCVFPRPDVCAMKTRLRQMSQHCESELGSVLPLAVLLATSDLRYNHWDFHFEALDVQDGKSDVVTCA